MRGLKRKLGFGRTFWPAGSMFSLVLLAQGCPFLPTGTEFPVLEVVVVVAEPATLALGGTSQARATLKDSYGNELNDIEVSWSSSQPAVATVTPNGDVTTAVVRGVSAGIATITASAEGHSGSAAVQVTSSEPPPPPPVSSVVVALGSGSVNAGGTTSATATLRDADGNVVSGRPVSWSSSNQGVATVSSTGETTAVVTAVAVGSTQIAASSEGKSGSVTLTVTDGTPSAGYPNQPSGFTMVTDRPFNLEAEVAWGAQSFVTGGLTIALDVTAPKSAPAVGQMRYPAGFGGGYTPGGTWLPIGSHGFTRLYLSLWVKVSSNWYGHPSVVNKLGFVKTHGNPVVYPAFVGTGSGPLFTQIRIQDVPGGAANYEANLANIEIRRGQWVRWEILLVNNTGDNANGQIHWWINGTKAGQHTNVTFGTSTQSKVWEQIQWEPIWGGVGSTVPEEMFMWMDHWYTSGAR